MKIPQEYEGLSKRDLIRGLISQNNLILNLQELLDKQHVEIEELKRRLLAYENAHTPPPQQRKYPKREESNNKVGAPKGHKGVTRSTPKPDKFEELQLCNCPKCIKTLGKPIYTEKKIIEDIPEPQPLVVTEFTINHYYCDVCDGWESYVKIAKFIQRCWAHILREAKWYAERYEGQSRLLYGALCEIYDRITRITVETVKGVRTRTYNWCMKEMKSWIKPCKAYTELRKFAEKIENELDYWFTCVLHPEIEPTNNKAERALREIVIQEKISKLRTEKGARIREIIMSVLATWKLQGLNTFSMLRQTLRS